MRSTFTNLGNMFRVPDLRNKVLFTLFIITVYRFGANIPCPGIDFSACTQFMVWVRSSLILSGRSLTSHVSIPFGACRESGATIANPRCAASPRKAPRMSAPEPPVPCINTTNGTSFCS